jgi:hypothetical protein
VTGRRGRRRKLVLDDLKKTRGYWILKEEAIHRPVWRAAFGRDYGSVVRQSAECTKREVVGNARYSASNK